MDLEKQIDYGDTKPEEMDKWRACIKLKHLSEEDQDDQYIWSMHCIKVVQDAGDKIPGLISRALATLPFQLYKPVHSTSRFRLHEWVGFKPMRHVTEGSCWTMEDHPGDGHAKTQRMHIPLEKEAPRYGSVNRIDDECEYWSKIRNVIGSQMDGEVLKDLINNSPTVGRIVTDKSHSSNSVAQTVWNAAVECVEDCRRSALYPGRGWVVMPPHLAATVAMEMNIVGGNIGDDITKKIGTMYWGYGDKGVRLYSHTDLTEKIVLGYRANDWAKCPYVYRPYSFGVFDGLIDDRHRDHEYFNRMQLVQRRMKKLQSRETGVYGVIDYNPTLGFRSLDLPLVQAPYPTLMA